MNRVRFIEHKGRRIVRLDFSGMKDVLEGIAVIAEAGAFIMVALVSRRKLEVFETRPPALEWLAKQMSSTLTAPWTSIR